jgi:transposase-like protein
LWRAVDQTGIVLDVLAQHLRDKQAAKRLLRKLLKKQMRPPRVMITDKLASYGAAKRDVMPGGSRPHPWYDAVRRRDEINIEEGGDPNAKVASETFGRALQQFGRRALVNLIALMGNYAGTAALLTVFDMQLDPDQPLPLPQL